MLLNQDFIVEIPKNASKTIKLIDPSDKNRRWQNCIKKIKNYHILLRDPYIRWLSATLQWIWDERENALGIRVFKKTQSTPMFDLEFHNRRIRENLIPFLSQIHTSIHTTPQIEYIPTYETGLQDYQNVYFYAREDQGLRKLFNRLNLAINEIPHQTNSKEDKMKIHTAKMIHPFIGEKLKNKVMNFYKEDYTLYRKHFPHVELKFDATEYFNKLGCNL